MSLLLDSVDIPFQVGGKTNENSVHEVLPEDEPKKRSRESKLKLKKTMKSTISLSKPDSSRSTSFSLKTQPKPNLR